MSRRFIGTLTEHPDDRDAPQIQARAQAIREAWRAVGGRPLKAEELDRILRPVNCRRTRDRLRKPPDGGSSVGRRK